MLNTQESINFFKNLKKSLSSKRFSGYHQRGTEADAMAKYLWNTQICESLYPCFHLLEVAFRNKVHSEIGISANNPIWITNEIGFLSEAERLSIKEAKDNLQLNGCPVTEDYLVSEMKFGFWTSLLNVRYELMWRKIIDKVFPNMPNQIRTRHEASTLMNNVRRLRNAALHHHSIWHWNDLRDRHK
jgi:Abi-like protein